MCNLPNQDSTRGMNSFDFLKRQTCFVGLKEIDLFSTTRWHDTLFFFSPWHFEKESILSLKPHKHILHSWQTSVIFTAMKFDLGYLFIEYLPTKLNSFLSIFFSITWFLHHAYVFVFLLYMGGESRFGFGSCWCLVSQLPNSWFNKHLFSFCLLERRKEIKF